MTAHRRVLLGRQTAREPWSRHRALVPLVSVLVQEGERPSLVAAEALMLEQLEALACLQALECHQGTSARPLQGAVVLGLVLPLLVRFASG